MTTVQVIWLILLIVAVVIVAPLVWYLLHRTWKAAHNIERYFAEMATAGVGVAQNTAHVKALESTIQVATTILSVAGAINEHAATVETALAGRAQKPRGKVPSGKMPGGFSMN